MMQKAAEIAARGNRKIPLPKGRHTTHAAAIGVALAIVIGAALFSYAANRPEKGSETTREATVREALEPAAEKAMAHGDVQAAVSMEEIAELRARVDSLSLQIAKDREGYHAEHHLTQSKVDSLRAEIERLVPR